LCVYVHVHVEAALPTQFMLVIPNLEKRMQHAHTPIRIHTHIYTHDDDDLTSIEQEFTKWEFGRRCALNIACTRMCCARACVSLTG